MLKRTPQLFLDHARRYAELLRDAQMRLSMHPSSDKNGTAARRQFLQRALQQHDVKARLRDLARIKCVVFRVKRRFDIGTGQSARRCATIGGNVECCPEKIRQRIFDGFRRVQALKPKIGLMQDFAREVVGAKPALQPLSQIVIARHQNAAQRGS